MNNNRILEKLVINEYKYSTFHYCNGFNTQLLLIYFQYNAM